MASWSMLEPPDAQGALDAADRVAAVRESWSWGAFWLGPVWLLWRRMWLVFLAWLLVAVLFSLAAAFLDVPDKLSTALWLLFSIWFAFEANALRRWTLLRHGWRFVGLATGSRLVEAEQRFFTCRRGAEPPPAGSRAIPASYRGEPSGGVIGLFPDPVPNGTGR